MILIKNGQNESNYTRLLPIIFIISLAMSCESRERLLITSDKPYQVLLNDSMYTEFQWYKNGVVKSIISKNKMGVKDGLQLRYYQNGFIKEKYYCNNGKISGEFWKYNDSGGKVYYSNYDEGVQSGNTYEFHTDQSLKAHFLFEEGNAIYLGYYENGEKQLNSPIPVFQEERIMYDSVYEAKITFPFPFKGNIEIYFQDSLNFRKVYSDKHNLGLTITNFKKSWEGFDMLLEYDPVVGDSLMWTEQVYNHTIKIKE